MSLGRLNSLLVLFIGSTAALACGGARDTDFGSDDGSAGEPGSGGSGATAQGGSLQGGSSGASSGSGGALQGGSANGGSPAGGTGSGGSSGSGTGGASSGGSGGTDPVGGTGGNLGGTGQGGSSGSSGSGGGGQGGDDCPAAIANAERALIAAQVCNPAIDGPKCTGSVQDLCECTVPVNDQNSEATKSYLALREAAMKCHPVCLAIVCREPTTPMCGIGGATTRIIVAQAHCTWSPR